MGLDWCRARQLIWGPYIGAQSAQQQILHILVHCCIDFRRYPSRQKTVALDSLRVPLRNLRRRSQEFLSSSKKSQPSKTAEKSAQATQPAPSPSQPPAQSQASPAPASAIAPQLPATADMNGSVSNGTNVPSYLLTGKVAVVTGSGEQAFTAKLFATC